MQINSTIDGTKLRVECRKPAGGYCVISTMALYSAWLAYRRETIELLDLRVWLACFELVARRCTSKKSVPPRYSLMELKGLLGGQSDRRLRSALRRLDKAGLLRWSGENIGIARTAAEADSLGFVESSMAPDGLLSRPAPVPRRFIRYLSGCRRPVVIATALGHVMRGAFLRNGRFVGGGRCKASWVADVFEVDIRNVKAARRTLIRDGWLIGIRSSQNAMNRWGGAFQFDFERRLNSERHVTKSPPPHAVGGTNSPPPYRNKNLLIGSERTMKPAHRGPIGSYVESGKEAPPTLRKVTRQDLEVPIRSEGLFREAVRLGFVPGTPAGRLNIFGTIEHAKAHGTKNACGLFVWILRNGRWNHINQNDEDRAQATIRALREGDTSPKRRGAVQVERVNGSASGATHESAPEAARQILAGTDAGKYPVLARLSACLNGRLN